ncbi:MAG: nitrogen regulation protein NR(II) [Gammaproteobacteria bacterium]
MTPQTAMTLLENLSTAVVVLDTEINVRYLNPAAEMLLQCSNQRMQGMPFDAVFSTRPEWFDELEAARQELNPRTVKEKLMVLANLQEHIVDFSVAPVTPPEGEACLLLEFIQQDRHLRISREEQIIAQQAATRALVRGMAHEIKNPLGGLRGAAQLLDAELDNPYLKEYTHIIIGEADRLQKLVDRLLGPNTLPQKRHLNIHEVLEHVRALVSTDLPPAIDLRDDYDPSIPDLFADRDQLVQVILNIVRNAQHALVDHGEIILRTRVLRQYTIGTTRHRLVASIEIIDNGPGIPEEIQDRLFVPMVFGRHGGTGLGLSIAQSLVNQHSGLIECRSRPGETVFTILLPLEDHSDG